MFKFHSVGVIQIFLFLCLLSLNSWSGFLLILHYFASDWNFDVSWKFWLPTFLKIYYSTSIFTTNSKSISMRVLGTGGRDINIECSKQLHTMKIIPFTCLGKAGRFWQCKSDLKFKNEILVY